MKMFKVLLHLMPSSKTTPMTLAKYLTKIRIKQLTALFVCFCVFKLGHSSSAQVSFSNSSLLVYRVGDGSTALNAHATQISVLEYDTSGALLQTINMPTTGTHRLTASGNQTIEGKLRYNGSFLAVPGYDAAVGTTNLFDTVATVVPRRVTVIENNLLGTPQTGNLGVVFNRGTIRGAIPQSDGSGFWAVGQSLSLITHRGNHYHDFASSTNTLVNTTDQTRSLTIYNSQLYLGRNSGGAVIQQVGTGLPTSATTNTDLPNNPFGRSFVFADIAGGTVMYATNDNTTIRKYSLVAGNWIFDGTSAASGAGNFLDLTAMVDNFGNVQIFAVTSTQLLSFTDSSGFNAAWSSGSWSTLASAGTNYAFRGITIVIPEPVTTAFLLFVTTLYFPIKKFLFKIFVPDSKSLPQSPQYGEKFLWTQISSLINPTGSLCKNSV